MLQYYQMKLTCIILLYIDIQYQFCCACECFLHQQGALQFFFFYFLSGKENGFYVMRNVTVLMWL